MKALYLPVSMLFLYTRELIYMYIYIYTHTCTFTYMYIHTHTYICMPTTIVTGLTYALPSSANPNRKEVCPSELCGGLVFRSEAYRSKFQHVVKFC